MSISFVVDMDEGDEVWRVVENFRSDVPSSTDEEAMGEAENELDECMDGGMMLEEVIL